MGMRRSEGAARALAVALALAAGLAAADPLAPDADSRVSATFARQRVVADVRMRAAAVAGLSLQVDGYALAVPLEAWSGLGAASSASLARREDGRFVLRLEGGEEASGGAWTAEIVFDRLAVRQRTVRDAATGATRQDVEWPAPELLD